MRFSTPVSPVRLAITVHKLLHEHLEMRRVFALMGRWPPDMLKIHSADFGATLEDQP